MLLQRLPDEIVVYVFSEWLHAHADYRSLDIACCNKSLRKEYFAWLSKSKTRLDFSVYGPKLSRAYDYERVLSYIATWSANRFVTIQKLSVHLSHRIELDYSLLPTLKSLTLIVEGKSEDFDEEGYEISFITILRSLPHLEELYIRNVGGEIVSIMNESHEDNEEDNLSEAPDTFEVTVYSLKSIEVVGVDFFAMKDVVFFCRTVVQNCPRLQSITFKKCQNIIIQCIYYLLQNLPCLQSIIYDGCKHHKFAYGFWRRPIDLPMRPYPSDQPPIIPPLHTLHLTSGRKSAALDISYYEQLLTYLFETPSVLTTSLRQIHLSENYESLGWFNKSPLLFSSMVSTWQHIEGLSLFNVYIEDKHLKEILETIAHRQNRLTSLVLKACPSITHLVGNYIAKYLSYSKYLHTLKIEEMRSVDDESIDMLCSRGQFPALKTLHLNECSELSAVAYKRVLDHIKGLREISFVCSSNQEVVDNMGIVLQMSNNTESITTMYLAAPPKANFNNWTFHMPNLLTLCVFGKCNLSHYMETIIKKHCPHVVISYSDKDDE